MKTNRKPQECCWCGYLLAAGKGTLFYVGVEDENLGFGPLGMSGWLVACLDKQACSTRRQEEKERLKVDAAEKRAADQREMALFPREEGIYVPGDHTLHGEIYEREGEGHDIYGYGTWYYDTGEYIWVVRNNGSDGADWSQNNVRTGGAGAIGFRYDRTPERVTWLADQKNVSERWRQWDREKKAEQDRVRASLFAAVDRAGGMENLKKMMAEKGMTRVCPRELTVNGRAQRSFTIQEVERILGNTEQSEPKPV